MATGVVTSGEFFVQMLELLDKLSSKEKHEMVSTLAHHHDERVCREAQEIQNFVRHEELSKDFAYVQRNSPLRPGTHLELFGGYDYYASGGHPRWLNGHECYRATFLGFARRGEDKVPVALIEFDDLIDVPGHKGRYGILIGSYGTHSFAWGQPEGTVLVHVVATLPDDPEAFCASHSWETAIESHASYRVEGTPGKMEEKNG
jgi:hypothetical protein